MDSEKNIGYEAANGPVLKLLKQSRRSLAQLIFSRTGVILLIFLFQLALLLLMFSRLRDFIAHYLVLSALLSAFVSAWMLNSDTDSSAKITWLLVILLLPQFGALLYIFSRQDFGMGMLKHRIKTNIKNTKDAIPQSEETMARLRQSQPGAAALAHYVQRSGCHPVFGGCSTKYYPLGEEAWADMLYELEQAKDFIYLEFFIVDEGLMWGRILEILSRKAAQGVDVRLMYDGMCEFALLPRDYPQRLKALGIQCKPFAPLTAFISTHYNYRDHRKILVIDGHTAFTGGVNLADEYINAKPRFGHWKDTALMVKGEAARSFALMFLQMWSVDEKTPRFLPLINYPPIPPQDCSGFVMPYADCPLDEDKVGELVYMDILNRARDYVYIMSPYLILDDELETALKYAAKRGVDVRLILPGIPDKTVPWALAKTHYSALIAAGVKVYEYSPGFVHAKVFLSDDREAVVGTINLDYRSLYHHFECACWLCGTSCIPDIRRDFDNTFPLCRQVTPESIQKEKPHLRLIGFIAKFLAPLL